VQRSLADAKSTSVDDQLSTALSPHRLDAKVGERERSHCHGCLRGFIWGLFRRLRTVDPVSTYRYGVAGRPTPCTREATVWSGTRCQRSAACPRYRFDLHHVVRPQHVIATACGLRPEYGRDWGKMSEGHRWLIGIVVAVASLIIAFLAWQYPKSAASPRPVSVASSTAPATTVAPTQTFGGLEYTQLQAGDCITDKIPIPFIDDSWPSIYHVVPCSQAHTAEVFFVDKTYWNKGGSYPGDNAILNSMDTGCLKGFQSYAGVSLFDTIYQWNAIVTDASAWRDGFRGLYCFAYHSTQANREARRCTDQSRAPAVGEPYN
jgi:hypothetical protein